MFRWFENYIEPFPDSQPSCPPHQLKRFYWHFVEPIWPCWVLFLTTGFIGALIEVSFFAYLGHIVDLMHDIEKPKDFFDEHSGLLLWIAFIALVARPIIFGLDELIGNQMITGVFSTRVLWKTHRYLLRQSLDFFQSDFAGRVSNKVLNTALALRESVMQMCDAVWFVIVYCLSAVALFISTEWRLALPLVIWIIIYILVITFFVPRIRQLAANTAEARSMLLGRIVDSYTNILTVKLFAHSKHEDQHAREVLQEHLLVYNRQLRMITIMNMTIWISNGILLVSTGGMALWLWSAGTISIGAVALINTLTIRIVNISGWIIWVVTSVFENIGNVQDGVQSISKSYTIHDNSNATPLKINHGRIVFDQISFNYGSQRQSIIEDLSLTIEAGEKIGLVGCSGAGKSTLISILLRFYELDKGRIFIDGQDISKVTQDSLRGQIGMVTQDTSLLHRSVLDNILYGRTTASLDQVILAARKAQAHDFIMNLQDSKGRLGYEAHVGERGVKLSGGQRQRIGIARVLLKNAPILILDEATSALDSEVEAAIQEQLKNLMLDKTVIAIAHRLSTIAAMDRLIVMDQGTVVEQGSHKKLIQQGGIYANFWHHQYGNFLLDKNNN
ncbi:MAG: putative multidrug export ATP-binding/permease protein [Hyphomicrobiaceae bacterium hypho_1]